MANDEHFFGLNKIDGLNVKIKHSHLKYLEMEESPKKLQLLSKLEGLIKEYLCLVPNENKYMFPETANIMHRSAMMMPDFSGYRACTAWLAISRYASNLLSQPWRKEYRTLRTYSGYYKHEIATRLKDPEIMFRAMGYDGDAYVMTLEGPIDPDIIVDVSRDAIVASVECQILKEIWEAVSQTYEVSWLEILRFRENNVGTPDQAICALWYGFSEQIFPNKRESIINYQPSQAAALPYQFPVGDLNSLMATHEENYSCHNDSNPNTGYYGYMCGKGLNSSCGYMSLDGVSYFPNYPPTLAYVIPVSSTNSTELDPSVSSSNHTRLQSQRSSYKSMEHIDTDETDACKYDARSCFAQSDKSTRKKTNFLHGSGKDTNNDWDYVYRDLENSGYSKDLGDRGDILRHRDINSRSAGENYHRTQKEKDKRSEGRNEARSSRVQYRDVEPNANSQPEKQGKNKPFNLLEHPELLKQMCEIICTSSNSSTIISQQRSGANVEPEKLSETFEELKVSEKRECHNKIQKWSCRYCTFLNDSQKVICDICGKSKLKGNEDKPLASGGKECPKCTLINQKDATKCSACSQSLEHSPTYI